jgi:hypothetical protein
LRLVTASARTLPEITCGSTGAMVPNCMSMRHSEVSSTDWAELR